MIIRCVSMRPPVTLRALVLYRCMRTAVYAYRAALSTKSVFEIMAKKIPSVKCLGWYDTVATGMQKYPLTVIVADDVVIRGNRYQDIKCEKKRWPKRKYRLDVRREEDRQVILKTMFSFIRLLY